MEEIQELSLRVLVEEIEQLKSENSKLKSNSIKLPCKVGDVVYKICPKCNDRHNGTCENCAWWGCVIGACDVGVKIYDDGSYNKNDLQIVKKVVHNTNICGIYDLWNIQYFSTPNLAKEAMQEYNAIRSIVDKRERVKAYIEWESKRKICNSLKQAQKN